MVNANIQGPINLGGVGYAPKRYGNYGPGEFKRLCNVVLEDGVIRNRRNVYSVFGDSVGTLCTGITNYQRFMGYMDTNTLVTNGDRQWFVSDGNFIEGWASSSAPGRPVTAGSFTKFLGFLRYNYKNYWITVEYTAGAAIDIVIYHGDMANPDLPQSYNTAYAATLTRTVAISYPATSNDFKKFRFNNFMIYKDRLWLSTSVGVYFSEPTNPINFTVPSGGFFKYPDSNVKWVMANYDSVYVITDSSLYSITYETDPNVDATQRPLSTVMGADMGCIHQDTPYVINNTGIYEISNNGVSRVVENTFDVGEDFYLNHIYSFDKYLVVNKYSKINYSGSPTVPGIVRTNYFPNGVSDTGGINYQIINGWATGTSVTHMSVGPTPLNSGGVIYPGYGGKTLEVFGFDNSFSTWYDGASATNWTIEADHPTFGPGVQAVNGDQCLVVSGTFTETTDALRMRKSSAALTINAGEYLIVDAKYNLFGSDAEGNMKISVSTNGTDFTFYSPVHSIPGGGYGGATRYYFQPAAGVTYSAFRLSFDATDMSGNPDFFCRLELFNVAKAKYLPTAAPVTWWIEKTIPFSGYVTGAQHLFNFRTRCGDNVVNSEVDSLTVKIECLNAANAVIGTTTETVTGLSISEWLDVSTEFSPPANTTQLRIRLEGKVSIQATGGGVEGRGLYPFTTLTFHQFLIELASTHSGYFNGNFTDTTSITYAWTGVAWESTSTADSGSGPYQFDEGVVFSPYQEGNTLGYNTFFIDTESGTVQVLDFIDQHPSTPTPNPGYIVDMFVNPRPDTSGNHNLYFTTSKLLSHTAAGFTYKTFTYRMNSSTEDMDIADFVVDQSDFLRMKTPRIDIEIDSYVPDGLEYFKKKFRNLEIQGIFPDSNVNLYVTYNNEVYPPVGAVLSTPFELGNEEVPSSDRPHFALRIGLNQRGNSISLRIKNDLWYQNRTTYWAPLEISDMRVLWSYSGRGPVDRGISS